MRFYSIGGGRESEGGKASYFLMNQKKKNKREEEDMLVRSCRLNGNCCGRRWFCLNRLVG